MIRAAPLTVTLALLAGPVMAQTKESVRADSCKPRVEILALLSETYREARVGFGLERGGMFMEFYANRKRGTWTYTVTFPRTGMNGEDITCISGHGVEWRDERGTRA